MEAEHNAGREQLTTNLQNFNSTTRRWHLGGNQIALILLSYFIKLWMDETAFESPARI